MAVYTFHNFADCARAIERDMRARERRLETARRKAARETSNYVARTIPRAFGELEDSVHVEDAPGHSDIIVDAPHAAAVEVGARPHWMPLEPLIAWVQLRGLQGLTKAGGLKRFSPGGRTRWASQTAARGIAEQLRGKLGRAGAAAWHARASMGPLAQREIGHDDATVAIAKAIQAKIAKVGTRPRRYMAAAVPPAMEYLDELVREALPDR